ncbi:hypothetical protein F5144DRAFT_493542 [Chaetomium tenue]|uniref:Uncharacterized protein n=1 Tax=Chaetomium tenue TaxID=1854479 RepID=A0ACB7P4K5_9PEZI|nr:hypothetical protein F5144DRAFT_493542 [Chaetomium globosum]
MRKHNVTAFPRPPIVERTNRHIQIKWHGQLVADCPPGEAYWVLEAHHAPGPFPLLGFSISITMISISFSITIVISRRRLGWPLAIAAKIASCVRVRLPLSTTPRATFSEFHGAATNYAIMSPISAADILTNRIWSYNEPPKEYEAIKGYIAFFVGPWECYVDNERAHAPPGDYYGGWVTSDIEGLVKPTHQQSHQWGTGWDGVF